MRTCSICKHPARTQIEDALLRNESCASIAERIGGASGWAIGRHSKHMHKTVVVQGEDAGLPLVDRIESLVTRLERMSDQAAKAAQWNAAVCALKEVGSCLQVIGKLSGQLQPAGQQIRVAVGVSVNANPPARELDDRSLELQIAMDVSEATLGFDAEEISRLKQLVERNRVGDDKLLEVHAAS